MFACRGKWCANELLPGSPGYPAGGSRYAVTRDEVERPAPGKQGPETVL